MHKSSREGRGRFTRKHGALLVMGSLELAQQKCSRDETAEDKRGG